MQYQQSTRTFALLALSVCLTVSVGTVGISPQASAASSWASSSWTSSSWVIKAQALEQFNEQEEKRVWTSLAVNQNNLWIGNDQGEVLISDNAGQRFQISQPGHLKLASNTAVTHVQQLLILDALHGYALTADAQQGPTLYQTRNAGYSWRTVYQGSPLDELGCMAISPSQEAWILGTTQDEHWHAVRSNNGRNWVTSKSGFSDRPSAQEAASSLSTHCARYENNTWILGTQAGEQARILVKEGAALRFQVIETPIKAGVDQDGVHAVWPLNKRDFLVAGGTDQQAALYKYQRQGFSRSLEDFTTIATPFKSRILFLVVYQQHVLIGNETGLYQLPLNELQQIKPGQTEQPDWQVIELTEPNQGSEESQQGIRALECGISTCWALSADGQTLFQLQRAR